MSSHRSSSPLVILALVVVGCDGSAPKQASKQAAASASAVASAAAAPSSVTFRLVPARVGEKTKVVRKATQKLGVEMWKDGARFGSSESSRLEAHARTTEVLGLVGRAPARVRVTYDRYQHDERRWDGKNAEAARLAGRTFVVDATDGTIRVSSEDGKPVSPLEEEALRALHADLGKEDPVIVALGTRPIPVGKPIPLRESLFRALLGSTSGTLKEGTLTLEGTSVERGREVARFSWSALMTSKEDNGLEVTWHFRGKLEAAVAPALTLNSAIEASLDVSGRTRQGGAWLDMQGSGTMQDDEAVTPL